MEGLWWLLGCTVLLGAVLAPLAYLAELAELVPRVARRLLRTAPPSVPAGRPVEVVAEGLRRLRPQLLSPVPGMPMARRRATTAAYDDLLLEAARALDVPDTLTALPPGTDRDAERLRVEHLLREAGLRLD